MDNGFWAEHGDVISAGITLVVAFAFAFGVDRLLFSRAERAAAAKDTSEFSREARTRLQLIRRLTFVAIVLIGIALALSQFAQIRRFAAGVLASTAVLGLVIGFAARTVIANAVAGILMAISQPVRVGDLVTIGEHQGRVREVRLTSTSLDSGNGRMVIVPNEVLMSGIIVNHSIGNRAAPITASLWLPPDADMEAARASLEETPATTVTVAELTTDGCRLELKAPIRTGEDRDRRESELREQAHEALRRAGVLEPS